ncbi:DUF1036 domain-containing protein [Streptomyces albireticuli]|nr:DUF1036 domain-containing protein [Streptomyces albireticuli]MCD9196531.1 DUF1036 domain-containing protein [Streptomyces albireticuli]
MAPRDTDPDSWHRPRSRRPSTPVRAVGSDRTEAEVGKAMLWLCNRYMHLVSAAFIMRMSTSTCPEGWLKFGWYNLNPGECRAIYSGCASAVNRYWYIYAIAGNGVEWAGSHCYRVPTTAFQRCLNRCDPGSRKVCFREFDVNGFCDFTLDLVA